MTEIIIQILKALNIYDEARKKFNSDQELAEMFDQNFDELCAMFTV